MWLFFVSAVNLISTLSRKVKHDFSQEDSKKTECNTYFYLRGVHVMHMSDFFVDAVVIHLAS